MPKNEVSRTRPPGDGENLWTRLTRAQFDAVEALADETGLSRSAAAKMLISEALANRARNRARDL